MGAGERRFPSFLLRRGDQGPREMAPLYFREGGYLTGDGAVAKW